MRALNTAATGMQAQQLNVEVIANNIANMNTTGFKRQRAEFQDLLYQNVERMGVTSSDAGTIVPTGVQVGVGVKAGSVYRVTEQGGIIQSTNAYDVAIQGEGYYIVQMPDGSAPQDVGAFELARFVNPAGLEAIGDNLFLETPASGTANRGQPGSVGFGTIQQGFLETSNVNAVTEISALITAQRAYEMNSKVITTTDEMLRTTSNLR